MGVELNNGYRFWDERRVSAVLEKDGRLFLKDGVGSLEIFQSWRDYMKDVVHMIPTKGAEDDIVDQLSISLGTPQTIDETVKEKRKGNLGDTQGKEVDTMAQAKKAAAPAKKANGTAKKSNGTLNDCVCGCGGKTGKNFVPGHDSKVHSWAKKVATGEIKLGSLPQSAQKYIRAHA